MQQKTVQRGGTALRNAILIGGMCTLSYLAVYIVRNILSAVSPQMMEAGVVTTEEIGTLSSVYFITYAVGQLLNGAVGDRIRAKYMISLGLVLAGICNFAFAFLIGIPWVTYLAYGLSGFFLSMIYGPMTRLVAENTEPVYTTRCTLGYTLASFLGSPFAGLAAMVLLWEDVFYLGSGVLLGMGALCFFCFSLFERQGIVQNVPRERTRGKGNGIRVLIRHRILRFTLISMLTGIVRTTVVFWLPTYLSQFLGYSSDRAAFLFTVATILISCSAFVSVFLYERLHGNMDLTILLSFCCATAAFLLAFFFRQPVWNYLFLILGIMASGCATTMLWSRYCPSLVDTGMVSSATGYLDFVSYVAASAASHLFASGVSTIGWGGLVLAWAALMGIGIFTGIPLPKWLSRKQ